MNILCKLKIHNYVKTDTVQETNKVDRGACIDTYDEKYETYKCTKCGATKKEIEENLNGRCHYVENRKLTNREWKNQ